MKIFKSLLSIALICVSYIIFTTLSLLALNLIEGIRNYTWFQGGSFYRIASLAFFGRYAYGPSASSFTLYLNELAASGLGAYFAIKLVDKILKAYNKKILFYGFAMVFTIFTTIALTLMTLTAESAGFGLYDFSLQILSPIVAIIVAYCLIKI